MHASARTTVFAISLLVAGALLAGIYVLQPFNSDRQVLGANTCSDAVYTEWSYCLNGSQTREPVAAGPIGCTPRASDVERNCTICTDFDYSEWSTCERGKQIRSVANFYPTGCTGGIPNLSRICNLGELRQLSMLNQPQSTSHVLVSDTQAAGQLQANGYQLESVLGYVFTESGPDSVSLVALTKSDRTIYAVSEAEISDRIDAGFIKTATLGYLYRHAVEDTMPLYRLSRQGGAEVYYTADETTKSTMLKYGFQLDGILAFIKSSDSH